MHGEYKIRVKGMEINIDLSKYNYNDSVYDICQKYNQDKNNGPGLLMIDTIEVIVDCRDSLKSHKADFVHGIDRCLFPGDSIGAVCIISGENDIKKAKPIKIVIKNSLGKKYCFEKKWVRDIEMFEEGSTYDYFGWTHNIISSPYRTLKIFGSMDK